MLAITQKIITKNSSGIYSIHSQYTSWYVGAHKVSSNINDDDTHLVTY